MLGGSESPTHAHFKVKSLLPRGGFIHAGRFSLGHFTYLAHFCPLVSHCGGHYLSTVLERSTRATVGSATFRSPDAQGKARPGLAYEAWDL